MPGQGEHTADVGERIQQGAREIESLVLCAIAFYDQIAEEGQGRQIDHRIIGQDRNKDRVVAQELDEIVRQLASKGMIARRGPQIEERARIVDALANWIGHQSFEEPFPGWERKTCGESLRRLPLPRRQESTGR